MNRDDRRDASDARREKSDDRRDISDDRREVSDEARRVSDDRHAKRLADRTPVRQMRRFFGAVNGFIESYPLVAYVCLVFGIAMAFVQDEAQTDDIQTALNDAKHAGQRANEVTDETLGVLVAVQIDNCRSDHKFRVQYKLRGEAEKLLLELFLNLAREQVAAGGPDAGTSQDFIEQFAPLTRDIRIIPVPNCDDVGNELREALGEGIIIPQLDLTEDIGPRIGRPMTGGNADANANP